MNVFGPALVLMNLVIQLTQPIIGTFTYSQQMTNCSLQQSIDLKRWYDVPDDVVTVLPNGDWLIDQNIPYATTGGIWNSNRSVFYRVVGQTVNTNQ